MATKKTIPPTEIRVTFGENRGLDITFGSKVTHKEINLLKFGISRLWRQHLAARNSGIDASKLSAYRDAEREQNRREAEEASAAETKARAASAEASRKFNSNSPATRETPAPAPTPPEPTPSERGD